MRAAIFIGFVFILSYCTNKNMKDYQPQAVVNEESPIVDGTCSSSKVSFAKCIKPIIEANCIVCHSATSTDPDTPGDFFFTNFSVLQGYATSKYSGKSEYKLQTHLKGTDPSNYAPMPYNKSPLSPSDIALIDAWVAKGAPND
jgi:hypothetical protein